MPMLRRDAAALAVERKSAAKWRRVRFRDNREPTTTRSPMMLGTPDDVRCWCGGPNRHDWAGKDDGQPHPR